MFARLPREERRAKPLFAGAPGRGVEALHGGLLRRALAAARSALVPTRLVTTGEARRRLTFPGLEVVRQTGSTFAERLEHAVAGAFADGWQQLVVIGGDTPTLDASHLRDAFACLDAATGRQAVIGPACDGGYYLLGLNAFEPAVFRDVPLCTAETGRATALARTLAGVSVATRARLPDGDDEADVRALARRPGQLRLVAALLLSSLASTDALVRGWSSILRTATIRSRGPPVVPPTLS